MVHDSKTRGLLTMNMSHQLKLTRLLKDIEALGGAFKVNGEESGIDGVLAGLTCIRDEAILENLLWLAKCAKDQTIFNRDPLQYIPSDQRAPWLDFKINCQKDTADIGEKWTRPSP